MLYYIIPPVIVIAAAAFLVSFVLKKASAMPAGQPPLFRGQKEIEGRKKKDSFWKKLSQFSLKVLEKIIQRFKLYSLKFHNCCQKWFQSVKKKRERHDLDKQSAAPLAPKKPEPGIISETPPGRPEPEARIFRRAEEIRVEPMVSKKVVLPETRRETRNRLEEALIERIAANPNDIEAYERLGDYYLEQGNYSEALECFKYVLKLNPAHHKAKARTRRLEKMLGK